MSKKKKKYKYFDSKKKDTKKKGKKGRRSAYKAPKTRDIKETLSKKEAKANKKVVVSPVDIPKEFKKNRQRCNHAGASISAAAYQELTPTYAAYTPALDRVRDMFGDDNVSVCKSCFDVVVKQECITADNVYDCLTYLYAAVNVALANQKLKGDEVKDIAKLKDVIFDFAPVLEILHKLEPAESGDTSSGAGGSHLGGDLNNNSAFVQ